jgi:hypothetical protein
MSDDPEADAILTRFRAALGEIHGDRLERVVLYGSRAGRSPARFGFTISPSSSKTRAHSARRFAGWQG